MLCQRAIIISGGRVVVESDLATLAREHEEALLVRAKGGAEAVAAALGGVPGVTAVEPREGGVVAVTDGSEGVRERMAKALMDQGLGLESMTEHRRTLEEAFLAAISAPAGAAGPDEPAAAPAESAATPGGMA
jgi:ABC-type uncharacterized transport system ATPase subunit